MEHILLVADQERLIGIFTDPGLMPGVKVRVARSAEQALAACGLRDYRCIFIQERFGEVSGHVLAHRLKSGAKGRKPPLAMLCDGEPDLGDQNLHAITCADRDDRELAEAVREFIAGRVSLPAQPRNGRKTDKASPSAADQAPPPPPPADLVSDVVALGATGARRSVAPSPRGAAGERPERTRFQAELESALDAREGPEATAAARRTAGGTAREPLRVTWGRPTLAKRIGRGISRLKYPALGLAAAGVIAIAVTAAIQAKKHVPAKRPPAKPATTPTVRTPVASGAPARGSATLPSFVPRDSRDPEYGRSHPGWERYLAPSTEFRVFREAGTIRAFQVIDRGGRGVSSDLFASALNELAGNRNYLVEARERKGAYLVESGRLAGGPKIIVYRHQPENTVKALVIDLH